MTPYYEDDHATIYLGDCLDLIDRLDYDVVVTDPPYGLMAVSDDGGYGRRQNKPDAERVIANDWDPDVRDKVIAATAPYPALVFGSPRLPEPPGDWANRLVWQKGRPGMNGGPWRYTHELIFVRGDDWVRVDDATFSVLPFQAVPAPQHPNEKPVGLLKNLLRCAPHGLVLDPFMGSGSTLRAAKDLGRKSIGIELEERYCEIAANRLAQEVLDLGGVA